MLEVLGKIAVDEETSPAAPADKTVEDAPEACLQKRALL
jgi:hypothetical protein